MIILRRIISATTICLSLGLVACSDKASNEPEIQPKGEVVEFSSEAKLELPTVMGVSEEGNLRAFDYKLEDNAGKSYPKPVVQFAEGQRVKVLCVIRNEASRSTARPVIIQELEFTYQDGVLKAESLPLTLPAGTDLVANPTGWRMICIVGADGFDVTGAGTASFDVGYTLPASGDVGDTRQLKTLYMNKDKGGADSWAKLKVIQRPDGSKAFQAEEPLHLVSQGTVLMLRVSNPTRTDKELRGFEIESNTFAFEGYIKDIANTTVNSGLPKFVSTSGYYNHYLLGTSETLRPNATTQGVYMVYAIPDNKTTNKTTITPYVGADYEMAKSYRYTFNPGENKFYNLSTMELKQKVLSHPIEAMLTVGTSNETYIGPVGKYDGGKDVLASSLDQNGAFTRVYSLPTEKQALALFPYSTDGGALGLGSYGILNFGDGKSYSVSENIEAFGSEYPYQAEYINPSSNNISYALRFKGGDNNKYFSAYRYEKTTEGVKITVRVLGPSRVATRLADISKESYWNATPEFEQKEFVRFIPKGKYWTQTVVSEAGGKYATLVRVFETDGALGMNKATNSAWVTDRRLHKDHPGLTGMNRSPYLLFTNVQ